MLTSDIIYIVCESCGKTYSLPSRCACFPEQGHSDELIVTCAHCKKGHVIPAQQLEFLPIAR